jgi:integrase
MADEIRVKVHSFGEGRALSLVYFDPTTGKKVAKTAGTTDRREAERKAAVLEDELNSGRYVTPSKLTWAAFVERFRAEKLAGMKPATVEAYAVTLNHVTRLVNPDRLCKLTAATVTDFAAKLRKRKAKPASVARHLRHLKAALRWAERQGLLAKAPRIEMPKLPGGSAMRGRPLCLEEVEKLVTAVPKVRPRDAEVWQRYLWGLWWSSLRLRESLLLSWDADAAISVDVTGQDVILRFHADAQKSGREEDVPTFPDFAAFLLATPEAERRGRVFMPMNHHTGRPMTPHCVGETIRAIAKAANVVTDKAAGRHATAHDLRRGCLTRWARRLTPTELQRMARHAHYSTTARYYVKLDAGAMAADLRQRFGDFGNKPGNMARESQEAAPSTEAANSLNANDLR